MIDIRKIIIIFVVAILFAVLVFSTVEAVFPSPKYDEVCKSSIRERATPYPINVRSDAINCTTLDLPPDEINDCQDRHGYIQYEYDSLGCATSYECETCDYDFRQAQEKHNSYVFYISAIFSLLAMFLGLYLPAEKNPMHEWIGTGFMLGGAFALFFGTVQSFGSLDRYARPIILLLELVLVIFVAYKKIGNLRKDSSNDKPKQN